MRDGHRLLREATREAHERLDALFMGFDLTTQAGYRRFIGAQAEAMLPIEAALDDGAAARIVDDWPARRRGALIAADVQALGLELAFGAAPSIDDDATAAGVLYVIEGSRHGARHLRKLVPARAPSQFLDADQAPGNWVKLLDRIDQVLYQPGFDARAVEAALVTFDAFERSGRSWMAKP